MIISGEPWLGWSNASNPFYRISPILIHFSFLLSWSTGRASTRTTALVRLYSTSLVCTTLAEVFFPPKFTQKKFIKIFPWLDFPNWISSLNFSKNDEISEGNVREQHLIFPEKRPFQGILADEMGLGKTLETLSLLLTNPKPQSEPHLPVDLVLAKVKKTPARSLTCHCYKRLPGMSTVHCAKCGLVQHAVCWDTEQIPEGQYFLCGPCQREHVCLRGRQDFTYLTHSVQYNTIWLIDWLIGNKKSDQLIDQLLIDWLIDCSIYCVMDGSIDWLISFSTTIKNFLMVVWWFCSWQLIECKTTLVVAPAAIIQQWQTEVAKSCREGKISVYEYKGIKREGFVSPWRLAQYDVVLVSYEMLSNELIWVQAEARKAS